MKDEKISRKIRLLKRLHNVSKLIVWKVKKPQLLEDGVYDDYITVTKKIPKSENSIFNYMTIYIDIPRIKRNKNNK